jgi:outer membrane protein OmpA-like peptidoglycan-associated protein
MTAQKRLDRKARVAVLSAAALILAGPIFVAAKAVVTKVSGEPSQFFHPQDDQLVRLGDGSTMLIKDSSPLRNATAWVKLKLKGEHSFQVGNANFVPGSEKLTPAGWEHLVQFARMLRADSGVSAVVLFSPSHGNAQTLQLEHMRADAIHDEVLKQGVSDGQIAVAPEAFAPGHNAAADEGLEIVLTNKG